MSITIPNPPGINSAGQGSVILFRAANPAAPKVSEVAAGVVLSCAIYGWDVTMTQAAETFARYCDTQPRQTPGRPTYSVADIVYDYDPQKADTSGAYDYYDELEQGTQWLALDLRGKDAKTYTPTAGDIADIIPIELGARYRLPINPEAEGEKHRTGQPVFVVGDVLQDVALVA